MALAKKAWSAACRLGDGEAVFQHLKADNFTIGDAEHDREVRLDDLAGSLKFGRERTKDHWSITTGQNVVDLKGDPLDHGTRFINEVGEGAPAGLRPIQGKTPVSPAISHSRFSLNSLAISAGSAPLPMRPRNSWARCKALF
jgi:hypothetical protein